MHFKLKKTPTDEVLRITYHRYRNYCNKILKKLKNTYEKQELQKTSKNTKSTWQTIKKITSSGKVKTKSDALLRVEATEDKSVESVNNFFSSIGKQLAQEITKNRSDNFVPSKPPPFVPTSFVLLNTSEDEVELIIRNLKSESATGWDNISPKLLKMCKDIIVPPITKICNLALDTGTFPDVFKRSLIHPIHKGGDMDSVNNYRPISVLPALSKILEKILNNRLMKFLEHNNLLSSSQFGFRRGRSTEDAINSLVDHVVSKVDMKKKCLSIFLDLKKAFDTVHIPSLLIKMERIGIRAPPLEIFKNYLTSRVQQVKIGSHVSSDAPVTFGIPQGSILGPSLFLIYINDICQIDVKKGRTYCFADDTALVFHGETWEEAYFLAEKGLQKVAHWLDSNLLSLNMEKTKYLAFSIRNNTGPLTNLPLKLHKCNELQRTTCDCPEVSRVDQIKYLGVVIDDKLRWKAHVDMTTSRVRKMIWVFRRLRGIADLKILNMLYYALCYSLINYCISVWGGCCKTFIIQLERAQRSVLKVMTSKPFRYPTNLLYSTCKVLTVRQIFIYHTIVNHHLIVPYDKTLFVSARRNYKICNVPPTRTSYIQKQHYFLAPFLYNKLNAVVKFYSMTYTKCKKALLDHLLTLNYIETESLILTCT
ncbi:hypothetical protein JYU34_012261 [Plutella xylostella]|uniref:Reverse transcriptase domain-containing protein n=1 Tax=Plutella xylostella TaxID=51655 RepID=A0ABQ7QER0_PLUXY|nr:hypothetical protein JYU34_012261 [Plutella xylostella]